VHLAGDRLYRRRGTWFIWLRSWPLPSCSPVAGQGSLPSPSPCLRSWLCEPRW